MSRIYVGNISRETTEITLRLVLEQHGRTVTHVNIKRNATTGKSRGFAFVDMGTPTDAEAAITALHGSSLDGRVIKVNTAKDLWPVASADRDYSSGGYSGGNRGRRGGGGRR